MKKILVAGGAGFIGTNLCKALLKRKYYVYCLDNNITGDKRNIDQFKNYTNFKYIYHDVNKFINLDTDIIFNLASPASPKQYQFDPVFTITTNFNGTLNLLKLAKRNKSIFLQASTSEIYGDPIVHPQKENYWGNVNPIGIRSCYDEGKRSAETLCFDFIRQYDVNVKVVRIFNTYGPYLKKGDGRVVSNFIYQSLKNKNITIFGSGNQTRSFCYIDDLIKALIKTIKTKKSFNGPVNLGNPNEISVNKLAKTIIKLTKSNSKLIYKHLPEDDPEKRKPNINLAKKTLDWKPETDLNSGLMQTIEYFKSIL
jgi:UDP-glucuronate decarboxylase